MKKASLNNMKLKVDFPEMKSAVDAAGRSMLIVIFRQIAITLEKMERQHMVDCLRRQRRAAANEKRQAKLDKFFDEVLPVARKMIKDIQKPPRFPIVRMPRKPRIMAPPVVGRSS